MNIFKWNDKARLVMLEKSEFYPDGEKVYEYGFYDGYMKAISDCKSNEILEMLIDIRNILESGDTPHVYKIDELIKLATEI